MRVYPTNNSIDNLEETYDKDGNKTLLLERKDILKFFAQAKKDIDSEKYRLFRLSDEGETEIIMVKKNSAHHRVLNKIMTTNAKTYVI